ncbi:serine/threonine-protein phosphatase [Leucobacter weissii]|uniref:Serine/threonine-protein phosphatase n=2 Tax=Leucobacter weissii TaxID=1983706 RepID=A0A939MKP0_9MICO|nr:protein phosphatase 2C domain-containing protein [Leucobacter weissii]MBO1902744.1 serine/threonine-protein phosphatase [Leucobacter weissii]
MLAADPCFLVSDGVGGYEAGDLASRAATGAFSEEFTAPATATLARIDAALEQARQRVAEIARGTERGAGCTLTGVIRIEHEGVPAWYVVNIGDSRVYLLRGSEFVQLTKDHSLREERLDGGLGGAVATPRNVITRALGSDDSRHDAWLLPIETGTRLLLCSDGLTTEVDDGQLRAVLSIGGRTDAVADELMRRALDAGGRDNVTLIVIDVVSGGVEPGSSDGPSAVDDGSDTTIEQTRPRRR